MWIDYILSTANVVGGVVDPEYPVAVYTSFLYEDAVDIGRQGIGTSRML